MHEEAKEWLGIKPADLFVYVAAGAIIWMYYNRSVVLDMALSAVAVICCILSCFIGMRADAQLSSVTNALKKVAYPGCLIAAFVCIYLNFTSWNG
jgi:hypothetical protein